MSNHKFWRTWPALCITMMSCPVLPSFSAPVDASSDKGSELQEIVVTAEKRIENLLDVPISISVLSGERLEAMRSDSLADFANYVPGLSIQSGGSPGQRTIVLRGLNTGYSQAVTATLVATYIDDEPFGGTSGVARAGQYGLDLMPYDIERVEVLKGPQGTLYGADAMGGIVKYSLRKPDLTEFEARVGSDLQYVDHGAGPGAGGRASVNIPIVTDTLGLRISGFYQHNPGFVDNVGTRINGSNDSTEKGGRATLLWKATDKLAVQATVLAQDINADDEAGVTFDETTKRPLYGADKRFTYFPEPYTQTVRDYSLHLDWDVDFATLTSSTSYSQLSGERDFDLTSPYYVPGYPAAINDFHVLDSVHKFTEEARLTSSEAQPVQWMFGGLYTREVLDENDYWPAFSAPGVPLPSPYDLLIQETLPSVFRERAVFSNVTYSPIDHFDISGGARYAQNDGALCGGYVFGLYAFPPGPIPCTSRPYQGKVTWMANSRYHLNQDAMFYIRAATGYRPGGGCIGCGIPELHVPDFYYSDSLTSYEGGFKGEFMDHRLQVDTSIYWINWNNIQLQVPNNGHPYLGNGGSAISRGLELTTAYALTRYLRLDATLAFTDAHLTQDAPAAGGANGDALPVTPRWTGSLSASYTRPLDDRKSLLFGGGYSYRDGIVNQFASSGSPLPIGPQNIVDLYAGLKMDHVTMRLYGKNVFNNESYTGLLYAVDLTKPVFVPIQPRTIGLSVDYRY
jgi:iron complex outermembrane receptor protein